MISLEDDIAQSMEQAMILNSFMQSLKPGPATLWLEGVADEVLAMRVPRRSGGLRPEPCSTVSALRAPAAIASEIEHLIITNCYSPDGEQIGGADFAAEAILGLLQSAPSLSQEGDA